MQNIPEIDNKIIEEHGLSLEEYEKILKIKVKKYLKLMNTVTLTSRSYI